MISALSARNILVKKDRRNFVKTAADVSVVIRSAADAGYEETFVHVLGPKKGQVERLTKSLEKAGFWVEPRGSINYFSPSYFILRISWRATRIPGNERFAWSA
jgi:hypothetical protein